jgi:methylmalonyl-CoA mutase N-terminal domain/subunit
LGNSLLPMHWTKQSPYLLTSRIWEIHIYLQEETKSLKQSILDGSYCERLTHEIADHGKLIEEVEELGMTKTIERGFQNLELKKQLHSKHVLIADKILL